jgi:hypothetical protein
LGTWHLLRWEIAYSDGRPSTLPFGPDATRSVPEAERLAAFESYFQYAGRFHTRWHEGRAQVVHQVSHALNPSFVGSEQVRNMDFGADSSLTLSASDPLPGSTTVLRHHRLIWQRRPAS